MTGSVLYTIVLTVLWFITGVRDLMGKDPLINLPFNQYSITVTLNIGRSGRRKMASGSWQTVLRLAFPMF